MFMLFFLILLLLCCILVDFVQQHLTEHDLLTANEELFLARQYKLHMQTEAHRKFMEEQSGSKVTDTELARVLGLNSADAVKYVIKKGKQAKSRLVKTNMKLVFHLIRKRFRNRGLAYPDLIQEGTFGLMKAVEKYNPELGYRFSTYAVHWIQQALSRAIADNSRITCY